MARDPAMLRAAPTREPSMSAPMPVYLPWLMTAVFGWLYYRRIRRHFGWQPWRPRRTLARIVVLSLVALLLCVTAVGVPHVAAGMAVGALAGVTLGMFALKHTRIDVRNDQPGYTTHPWIGGVLSLLLVARLTWRWHDGAFSQSMMQQGTGNISPLTMSLAAMLIGYGLVQSVGMRLRMRAMA